MRELYERCYLPAQRLYAERYRPELCADVVVDNQPPAAPRLEWREPPLA